MLNALACTPLPSMQTREFVACVPQSWAAAAPFGLMQACLGLEIDAAQRVVRLRHPRLPASVEFLHIRGLQAGDAHGSLGP